MPELETSLIFIMSMITYAICELPGLELAAIVAIFVFGIMQSHYNRYNLSEEAVEKAGFTYGFLSYICEALILVYFGLSFDIFFKSVTIDILYYALINFGILLVMRFTTVFLLVGIVGIFNKKQSLSMTEVSLVSFSGMIRGSIAYALVVKLSAEEITPQTLPLTVSIAQVVIAMTMYIFIPLNPWLFTKMLGSNPRQASVADEELQPGSMMHRGPSRTILLQKRTDLVNKSDSKCKTIIKRLDEFVMKPLLIRNYEERVVGKPNSSCASRRPRRKYSTRPSRPTLPTFTTDSASGTAFAYRDLRSREIRSSTRSRSRPTRTWSMSGIS